MLGLWCAKLVIMAFMVTVPPVTPIASSTPTSIPDFATPNRMEIAPDKHVTIGSLTEISHKDDASEIVTSSGDGDAAKDIANENDTAEVVKRLENRQNSNNDTRGTKQETYTSEIGRTTPSQLNVSQEITSAGEQGSTLRPLDERMCFQGFECIHGVCHLETFSCVCDTGWFGPTCDQTCVPSCSLHETCLADDNWNPRCVCDPDYTGACESDISTQNTTTSTPMIGTVNSTVTINNHSLQETPQTEGIWEPLEGYGPLAPLSWRRCEGGPFFECRYGNCTFEDENIVCKCEPNFSDNLCDKPCLLQCGELGKCKIVDDNDTEECFCSDHRYRGYNCSTLIEEDEPSGLQIEVKTALWVVAVLLLFSIVLLMVSYALWRKRNITMMKIVYWFQAFEEDDDRDFDAFVSYSSADFDHQFVLQVLTPRLEGQMCFSLCLHHRDFLAGQYISQNISESVKRSRRTIMVVSPAYVSSDWCRFEFQMALQEMVSQKHRILPILLDDVSSLKKDMDETLRKVLEAVTWIKYPGSDASNKELDQFWKRIILSMPKKRPTAAEQGSNNQQFTSVASPSLSPDIVLSSPS
ncbi:hypothetical protein RRG08_063652 [Elysia crispata]|uniref:TIR domain-containing protein n=1 Tax=Elysia crispata TaxID=231223 RepID=A0AAE0Y7S6_9GAST|nr:hypothetical protein RRG08_063652 [Elysia crispata]